MEDTTCAHQSAPQHPSRIPVILSTTALVVALTALSVLFLSGETPVSRTKNLVLTPKAELEVVQGEEGVHWTFAPDTPPAINRTKQKKIVVEWEATEEIGDLDPENDVQYEFWGFEHSVPGPVLRVRQGDVVEFHLTNNIESVHPHNIDFHFSTGPGGGAKATNVAPGETAVVDLRALQPGFFMYHCATADVPSHISNGMYGGVIVDPIEGLPAVDNEFYVVQSEFYTESKEAGVQTLNVQDIDDEHPNYMVFNGAVGSLLGDNAPKVQVGDSVRIYMLNAGLNLISSFHVIGEIFDRVYREADVISEPAQGVQTTLVPAGGAAIVDFLIDVPGTYILVDHALSRAFHKGLVGTIVAEGEANTEIFESIEGNAAQPHSHDENKHEENTETAEVRIMAGSWANDDDPLNDYDPYELTVKVGTTVTWVNDDETSHTATAIDGSFDSGYLEKGESWSYTFDTAGEYDYLCTPHPWMKGRVIVEE